MPNVRSWTESEELSLRRLDELTAAEQQGLTPVKLT
jgi:hypothetical protein